ncbi:MAG: flavodoxin family protein [Anaerolineae bacterium]|nr:flavodoxin family protein [Anaerolineae bacterium]
MGKIRLLGISASPRKSGNSRYLLERSLGAAEQAAPGMVRSELYSFAAKNVAPCLSCFRCADLGDCATEDDFQVLREKWAEADAIIYSVPVYHIGIPGQLKCFVDRLGNTLYHYYGGKVSRSLKSVGVVVQGSHLFAGQEQVITTLINHAVLLSCVPVAGDPWPSYLGAAGWTRNETRKDSLRRLYEEGEADAQITIAAAESLGKRVAQMALLLKAGGEASRERLQADGSYDAFLGRLASANEGL